MRPALADALGNALLADPEDLAPVQPINTRPDRLATEFRPYIFGRSPFCLRPVIVSPDPLPHTR